jgi:NAD(P)-dependent dehydrogenase (short-subunit alcohol dehydrogenase family)
MPARTVKDASPYRVPQPGFACGRCRPEPARAAPIAPASRRDRGAPREIRDALHRHPRRIPWHRAGQPDEIARAILYLASDAADDVTGHTLVVDGGLTMQWGGA